MERAGDSDSQHFLTAAVVDALHITSSSPGTLPEDMG